VIVGYLMQMMNPPSVGPDGPDEKDRVLEDEFHPNFPSMRSLITKIIHH
jgi:hypothetical protein